MVVDSCLEDPDDGFLHEVKLKSRLLTRPDNLGDLVASPLGGKGIKVQGVGRSPVVALGHVE